MAPIFAARICALFGVLALALAVSTCTADQKKVATAVVDVSNALCDELDGKADSEFIEFLCTATDVASGVVHTFKARVRREDGAVFAARHCAEGEPSP